MITVLNLLENARNNFYKPTKVKFIDLIQSLPATLLDFSTPPEEESELKGKSIKDLLKENKVQILCNHVLFLIKNWRFLYKYALTCYYLSDYLKGVNKYAARYS